MTKKAKDANESEDIRDILGAAFDESVKDDDDSEDGDELEVKAALDEEEDSGDEDNDASEEEDGGDDSASDTDGDKSNIDDDASDTDGEGDDEGGAEDSQQDSATGERAPESWTPALREEWAAVPESVKKQINHREREISSALTHTTDDRRLAKQFKDTITPYIPMLQASGIQHPLQAVQQSMSTLAQLSQGNASQKAKAVVELITGYGVDLNDIADAYEGKAPQDGGLSNMIDEKLKPITDHFNTMQNNQNATISKSVQEEFNAFAKDPANEFFQDVRHDMNEIILLASNRGESLTLKQAYDKSVAMRSDIQTILVKRSTGKSKSDIRKKKAASSSIKGKDSAPKSKEITTARGAIEAAWDDVGSA